MIGSIHVRGDNTRNWKSPRDPFEELHRAIDEVEVCCEGDGAYKELLYKLELVEQELDFINQSPGRRATLRAAMPNHSGQEPSHRHEEAPMAVQRSHGA